ncbi:MAG: RHS repeat protein, partial [Verrucomicrobia bacterium]|nr:RHS repeat protein [Verrucomicrobiota bacterium]
MTVPCNTAKPLMPLTKASENEGPVVTSSSGCPGEDNLSDLTADSATRTFYIKPFCDIEPNCRKNSDEDYFCDDEPVSGNHNIEIKVVITSVDYEIDHVCTTGVHSDTHDVTVTVLPSTASIDLELQRVAGTTGAAVFFPGTSSTTNITGTTTVTIMGTAASDVISNMVMKATLAGCSSCVCASNRFTVVDAEKLVGTEVLHTTNTVSDTTQSDDTNTVWICQTSNNTAQLELDFSWMPTNYPASEFHWQALLTNGTAATEWGGPGTFENNPTNITWTPGSPTNREFKIRSWFDCDEDNAYTNTEPHRIIDVKVVDFVKLMLTNSVSSNAVVDITRPDEPMSTNNTLYLCESTNGTAEMDIQGWWKPETVSSNRFRWEILLTNGAAGATQWSSTNGTFATNPSTSIWTNSASAGGVTSNKFLVRGWYDCDKDTVYDSDEPHRLLYVAILGVDLDMDSDHTHDYDGWPSSGEPTSYEDTIEADPPTNRLGLKYVVANDFYETDTNGIPGYADGFDLTSDPADNLMAPPYGATNVEVFVEVQLALPDLFDDTNATEIVFTYDDSDPWGVVTNTTTNGWVTYTPTNGTLRLWQKDQAAARTNTDFICSGSNYTAAALGFSSLPGTRTFYLEAVTNTDALAAESIKVAVRDPSKTTQWCTDVILCTPIRVDVDVDTDNDDGYDVPLRSLAEDHYEDMTNLNGKVLLVNDDDTDEDGLPDFIDGYNGLETFGIYTNIDDVVTNEQFVPIVFEIPEPIDLSNAKVLLAYSGSDPLAVSNVAPDSYEPAPGQIRIWTKDGDQSRDGHTVLSVGDYLAPDTYTAAQFGFSTGSRTVTNYIESVRCSTNIADIRIIFKVDPDGDVNNPPNFIAPDAVRATAVKPPRILAVTDYFTPRQSESPPYHVCKVDFTPGCGPIGDLVLQVKESTNTWDDPFYVCTYSDSVLSDTKLYKLEQQYELTNDLYCLNARRIAWDGRKDSDDDSVIDLNTDDFHIWADRPANTDADDEIYDVRLLLSFTGTSGVTNEFESTELETKTCPLQLDSDDVPMMGPAPYFGFFRGQINSKYDYVHLGSPSMLPKNDGRPVPELSCYFNGNHWRHTPMKFGWTHTYEVRLLPVYTNGVRKLFLLHEGDHLLGPVDEGDGSLWIYGEKATVTEVTKDETWVMTNRVHTVYDFVKSGQIEKITDRNLNKVDIDLDNSWGLEFIQRVEGVTGADLSLDLKYNDPEKTQLDEATLGGRSCSFTYNEVDQACTEYGTDYDPDEIMKKVVGPQYTNVFFYKPCRRTNPPSRVICGPMTNRVVGGISHNYTYGASEVLSTVVSEAIVDGYNIGITDANPNWRTTGITGSVATYSGTTETHDYSTNKLQSINVSGSGGGIYKYDYDAFGRRLKRSSAAGDVSYGYDSVGNLLTVSSPDYSLQTYSYGACNQVSQWEVTSPPRLITNELNAAGNVLTKTEIGDGDTGGDREWTFLRDPADGSIDKVTSDPNGSMTEYSYDNSLGLPSELLREGVRLLYNEHDPFGNVLVDKDPEENITTRAYDGWDRVDQIGYANGETETSSYRSLNDLETHVAPAGEALVPLTTSYSFNSDGKPMSHSLSGTAVDYSYEYSGITDVDNEGNLLDVVVTGGGTNFSRSYTYDCLNRMTREQWASQVMWARSYDEFNNVLSATDGAGSTNTYTYYSDNALGTHDRAGDLGSVTHNRDGVGNSTNIVDNPGVGAPVAITQNTFDRFNRVRAMTDPRGESWAHTYDKLDNHLTVTDPLSQITTYEYDPRGYRDTIIFPDLASAEEERNDMGILTNYTDPRGYDWIQVPDEFARVYKSTSPEGVVREAQLNIFGQWTSRQVGTWTATATVDALSRHTLVDTDVGTIPTTWGVTGVQDYSDRSGLSFETAYLPNGLADSHTRVPDSQVQNVTMDGNMRMVDSNVTDSKMSRERNIVRDGNGRSRTVGTLSGASVTSTNTAYGDTMFHHNDFGGNFEFTRDPMGLLTHLTPNGDSARATALSRDAVGNVTNIVMPGGSVVSQGFNSRNMMTSRTTTLGGATLAETFDPDDNGNIVSHVLTLGSTAHTIDFEYDDANRLEKIQHGDMIRTFDYIAGDDLVWHDTVGPQTTTYGYDSQRRVNSINGWSIGYDAEGRTQSASGPGGASYSYGYSSAKLLTNIVDSAGSLGGAQAIRPEPDALGEGWKLHLPEGVTVGRGFNDVYTMVSNTLSVGGTTYTVTNDVHDYVIAQVGGRSGGAPDSTWGYNAHNEPLSAHHTSSSGTSGVTLVRNTDGTVSNRTDMHFSRSTTYSQNSVGWLTREINSEWSTQIDYREDGIREQVVHNGRKTEYEFTPAGRLIAAKGLVLGVHRLAAPEGECVASVGGTGGFTNIEQAVKAVFSEVGAEPFSAPKIICVDTPVYAADVLVRDTGYFADNLDAGDGSAWSDGLQSGGDYTTDLTQSAIRIGESGYAPEFHAADAGSGGDYAYLSHAFSPAVTGALCDSFWVYVESEDLDSSTDKAVLFRAVDEDTNSVLEFCLEADASTNLLLRGYHQALVSGTPTLVATGEYAVVEDAWYQIAFTHTVDTNSSSSVGNGRFRWWVDGSLAADEADINAAVDVSYTNIALGAVSVTGCSVTVLCDDFGIAALNPTNTAPLIIRSPRGEKVSMTCTNFVVERQKHVRLQGFWFYDTSTNAILSGVEAEGLELGSCVIRRDVLFTNCSATAVIGNTMDYQLSVNRLLFSDCTNAVMRNNIFLNTSLTWAPWALSNSSATVSHSMYHPIGWLMAGETSALFTDPQLHATGYWITDSSSDAITSGLAVTGFGADVNGWRRHPTTPCRGAVEYLIETVGAADVDAGGRILKR